MARRSPIQSHVAFAHQTDGNHLKNSLLERNKGIVIFGKIVRKLNFDISQGKAQRRLIFHDIHTFYPKNLPVNQSTQPQLQYSTGFQGTEMVLAVVG